VLSRRILTAVIFGVAVVAAITLLPSLWAGVLLGALWLTGAYEWAGFAGLGRTARLMYVLAHAVAMVVIGQLLHSSEFVTVVLGVALLWWLVVIAMLYAYPKSLSAPVTMLAGLVTLAPSWALLAWLHSAVADGPLLLLGLLAVVWSADSGAYFCGRAFGRHKLAPSVSPGKTWEGVAGGVVAAALFGAAASLITDVGTLETALLAAATAAVSVLGDLNVSMFKRNAGLKDSGRVLPGHGGVLDRADSVTAAAAMFVFGLILVGIIT
jgi:phosphatidate cytidylyltransferase